ncbi:MAG: glycosyltransferase [Gaiellaceae bacterium]
MTDPAGTPRVSLIVPTRDRPSSLRRCLVALERQTGIADFEVVVVDDGSLQADEVARVVASAPHARVLRQERPRGPAAARNRGTRAARGSILLFTDDDCEPAPDWAARLTTVVDNGAHAAAGVLVNGRMSDRFAAATDTVLSFMQQQARRPGGTTTFATTNNLACRAELLAEFPFDERFRQAGEDRDWCARVVAAGHSLILEPRAAVLHLQDLTGRSFWRKHVNYGRASYRFHRLHVRELESPRFYAGLVRSGFSQGVANGLLVGVAQLATVVGFVREALADRARS